jgi:hypothetical protein
LLYKNALDDRARTTFGGLIRVEPHAHFTDAYQKVRNLLLSDDAEANSMPGLEILADNVRCTHGATSGQIDEDELFYLRTRGIPDEEKFAAPSASLVTGFLDFYVVRSRRRINICFATPRSASAVRRGILFCEHNFVLFLRLGVRFCWARLRFCRRFWRSFRHQRFLGSWFRDWFRSCFGS